MKYLVPLIFVFASSLAYAQGYSNPQRFVITTNGDVFIKLDTRTGKTWILQKAAVKIGGGYGTVAREVPDLKALTWREIMDDSSGNRAWVDDVFTGKKSGN